MYSEQFDVNETIRSELNNPDIEGVYRDRDGRLILDRRHTLDAIARLGLSPRTADLNLIGPDRVPIPEDIIQEMLLSTGDENDQRRTQG